MDLNEKVHIMVKMTSPVIFSGFLDVVIKQFLSKEKLLGKRRKQSFSLKNIRGLSFRGLSFRGFSFKVLDLRS